VTDTTLCRRAAELLEARAATLSAAPATIGLDGFVDEISQVVDKRQSPDCFTPFRTLADFAEHVRRGAGRSSNAELVVTRVKLGGNGPIMANALAALGVPVTCIGNLGWPSVHPAFDELARRARIFSVAEPGHTDALEFSDGKLMLGKIQSLNDITWENLLQRVGRERLRECFAAAALVGLQNWTMIPFMSEIWQHVLEEICPRLPAGPRRTFFFDLADPERRDPRDIAGALELIGRFERYFDTWLGLNEKEAFEIGHVLGYLGPTEGQDAVRAVARHVRDKLGITGVVVHPRAYAYAVAGEELALVTGPFTPEPLISTGAGDHFNAGFCLGKLLGADNPVALQLGVGVSGYYVRTGHSPAAGELAEFLRSL
jgi:sugar/nucleoside kinase (ribokinase family)